MRECFIPHSNRGTFQDSLAQWVSVSDSVTLSFSDLRTGGLRARSPDRSVGDVSVRNKLRRIKLGSGRPGRECRVRVRCRLFRQRWVLYTSCLSPYRLVYAISFRLLDSVTLLRPWLNPQKRTLTIYRFRSDVGTRKDYGGGRSSVQPGTRGVSEVRRW